MTRLPPSLLKILLVAVCLSAVALITWGVIENRETDTDEQARTMHRECGVVMARLATRAAGDSGSLLVLEPATDDLQDPDKRQWIEEKLASFYDHLGSGITVREKQAVGGALSRRQTEPGGLTAKQYVDILARHPDVDAVVSFVGEPTYTGAFPDTGGTPLPPLVCFAPRGTQIPALMKKGIVVSAVVPRSTPSDISAARDNWFDALYEVVTPETVDEWAGHMK